MRISGVDDLAEILFEEALIQRRTKELAGKILEDYKDKELIWVTVMKGADNFSRDLRKETIDYSINKYKSIRLSLLQDIVIISLYKDPENPKKQPGTILGPDPEITYQGKDVLIVEDIIDRGLTMKHLLDHLNKLEPASINLCSLLSKPSKREIDIPVKYLGFEVEDVFVVGYGLDFYQKYRDLPFIGVLKPEVYGI